MAMQRLRHGKRDGLFHRVIADGAGIDAAMTGIDHDQWFLPDRLFQRLVIGLQCRDQDGLIPLLHIGDDDVGLGFGRNRGRDRVRIG